MPLTIYMKYIHGALPYFQDLHVPLNGPPSGSEITTKEALSLDEVGCCKALHPVHTCTMQDSHDGRTNFSSRWKYGCPFTCRSPKPFQWRKKGKTRNDHMEKSAAPVFGQCTALVAS